MNNIEILNKKLKINYDILIEMVNICNRMDVNIKEMYFKKVKVKKNKYKIYIIDKKTKKKIYTFRYKTIKLKGI